MLACAVLVACSRDATTAPQPSTPAAHGGDAGPLAAGAPAAGAPAAPATSTAGANAGAAARAPAPAGASAGATAQAGSAAGVGGRAPSVAGAAADGGGAAGAAAGAGSAAPIAGAAAGEMPSGTKLPPVANTDGDGPFEVMQDFRAGPRGQSGLFRPSELGKDGVKHPVFVWGCGGGSNPMSYADQLRRIASHGFVVIAEVSQIGDDGAPLKASVDWLIAENERSGGPFAGKLDGSKIALGGHSIGSVNSFMIADDPRLTTTVHVAGGSLDNVNDPFAPTTGMGGKGLIHPVAYVCSMSDTFATSRRPRRTTRTPPSPRS